VIRLRDFGCFLFLEPSSHFTWTGTPKMGSCRLGLNFSLGGLRVLPCLRGKTQFGSLLLTRTAARMSFTIEGTTPESKNQDSIRRSMWKTPVRPNGEQHASAMPYS